jgi:hypothetical protein
VRLQRELAFWSRDEMEPERRDKLVRQSKALYRRSGPSYHFVIPLGSGHCVRGWARRMSVGFVISPGLPADAREPLLRVLRSGKMGEPVLDDGQDDA